MSTPSPVRTADASGPDAEVASLLTPRERWVCTARVSLWNYAWNFGYATFWTLVALTLLCLSQDTLNDWAGDGFSGTAAHFRWTVVGRLADEWTSWWMWLLRLGPLGLAFLNVQTILQGYYSIKVVLTDYRVLIFAGIFSQQTVDLPLVKVESMRVYQDVVGRLFHYGSVIFHGIGDSMTVVYGIRDPMGFKRLVDQCQADLLQKANTPSVER